MKTVEVRNSLFWGLVVFSIGITVALIGQVNRTGELYQLVSKKQDTAVWIEGGDILKAQTIDSLQNRVKILERQVNKN